MVLTGRPLLLGEVVERAQALLLAWHPGSLGGPAIVDLLFGMSPTGRLPVSLPRSVGQVPIYYAHKPGGRPPPSGDPVAVSGEIRVPPTQYSGYLDEDHRPQFPFGFGLTYTTFSYGDLQLEADTVAMDGAIEASVLVTNTGHRRASELVQVYFRDLVASVTRPVQELIDFRRITLDPGEGRTVHFRIPVQKLAFHGLDERLVVEPGEFRLWIAPSADAGPSVDFTVVGNL